MNKKFSKLRINPKKNSFIYNLKIFSKNWFSTLFRINNPIKIFLLYGKFINDFSNYNRMSINNKLSIINTRPELFDNVTSTTFDFHYVFQSYWAFQKIISIKPKILVDIGSQVQHNALISLIVRIICVDIRPLAEDFINMKQISSDILHLPFPNNSIEALSCLHVVEHIGLGRYGDKLNPNGTQDSCKELARILMPGGDLFLSLPVGKPRVCFNSHRINDPILIRDFFQSLKLKLKEFSIITDNGSFFPNQNPENYFDQNYACGCYHFIKDF